MGAGESKGSGATLQETGNAEVGQARGQRKIEAVIDRAAGSAKTYVAVLVPCPPCSTPRPHTFTYIPIATVGPSAKLRATRLCNRQGTRKQAMQWPRTSRGSWTGRRAPVPSGEALGLKETVAGALQGDQERQAARIATATKAMAMHGV